MARPRIPWPVARVALLAVGRGATVPQAAVVAGIGPRTVDSLISEYGRMTLRERTARQDGRNLVVDPSPAGPAGITARNHVEAIEQGYVGLSWSPTCAGSANSVEAVRACRERIGFALGEQDGLAALEVLERLGAE